MHVFEAHETLQDCEDEGIKENPHISSPSDKNKLYINHVNTLSLVGETTSLYVSYNTHYIFVSIKRKKWELDAMRRRYNLCQLYKNDTSNSTLEMLTSHLECFATSPKEPRLPSPQDFLQIATLCLPSMECASLKVEEITSVEDRYYNNYGFEKIICPKGSFCKTGKHLCPVGFTCGKEGMSLPDRCVYEQTGNTHCFGEGLHKPVTSKNGTIAIAPYMPPFPASPGMKQTAKDVMVPILKDNEIIKTMQECRSLKNCTFGEFCPIGGSNAANNSVP